MGGTDRKGGVVGDKSKIEWTDATWNPIRGTKGTWSCVKISEGCKFCYAERLNLRRWPHGGGPEYKIGADELRLDEKILIQPLRWLRHRRIFVCSMTDLFEERVENDWIDCIFAVMALTPQHTFQVLTKRAARMAAYCAEQRFDEINEASVSLDSRVVLPSQRHGMVPGGWPLPNVWLGVSVENQARADERIPWLLKTPAAVRFLSVEPLLGPVDLKPHLARPCLMCGGSASVPVEGGGKPCPRCFPVGQFQDPDQIGWVIVGGESGGPPERALVKRCNSDDPHSCRDALGGTGESHYHAKPDALEWVRTLRDQCVAAGVPFLFKQWGGPTAKSGGRILDGRTWDEYPEA